MSDVLLRLGGREDVRSDLLKDVEEDDGFPEGVEAMFEKRVAEEHRLHRSTELHPSESVAPSRMGKPQRTGELTSSPAVCCTLSFVRSFNSCA